MNESNRQSWPSNKAVVLVEDLAGNRLGYHEFNTNQEAADLLVTYDGKPVNITYKPIGAVCDAFLNEVKTFSADEDLFRDIMLDIL